MIWVIRARISHAIHPDHEKPRNPGPPAPRQATHARYRENREPHPRAVPRPGHARHTSPVPAPGDPRPGKATGHRRAGPLRARQDKQDQLRLSGIALWAVGGAPRRPGVPGLRNGLPATARLDSSVTPPVRIFRWS